MKKNIRSERSAKPVNYVFTLLSLLMLLTIFSSCGSKEGSSLATIKIEDPYRKYYPVVQGQKLKILINIENTSDVPLRISNVLPSCGCTTAKFPKVIGARGFGIIEMEYNSIKNIGYVGFHTTIVANTKEKSHTFFFETNVVSDALYTKDYEELYEIQKQEEKGSIQEMVDGAANVKGYIIDETEKRKFK
jgi:hypothetical protein